MLTANIEPQFSLRESDRAESQRAVTRNRTRCGIRVDTNWRTTGASTRFLQDYLGHRDIRLNALLPRTALRSLETLWRR